MMQVHIPTMFLMIVVLSVSLAIAVAAINRAPEAEGTGYWALAFAANALPYLLFTQRGQASDWLTVVLANVVVSTAFASFTLGILQFQKRRLAHWIVWAPVAVTAIVFAWLLPWQNARNVASALVLTVQGSLIVGLVLQKRHETVGRGQYFVVFGFVLIVAVSIMQAVSTLMHLQQENALFLPDTAQVIKFLVYPVSTVLLSLGLVVMTKERADARNRELAMRDSLTGMFNRRSVLDALAHHIALAKRTRQPLSVLMIDIDFFKRVNDTHGHLSGDRVLRTMGEAVLARIRQQDTAGRWGGEEFLVILPNTALDDACQLAQTLRKSIAETPFCSADEQPISITASIGVSALDLAEDQKSDDLVGLADEALYRAKQGGRNRVEVARLA